MPIKPRITVLISTYNDRAHVAKKLTEVRAQSIFEDAEFIFLETASPQRERVELEPFCEQFTNCRLIATEERLSLYEAWNLGWESAKAPFVCISNMDDAMHPQLLESVIRNMESQAWDITTVLIGKQFLEDPDRDSWAIGRLKKLDLQERPGAFFAWRRDLQKEFGRFDTEFRIAGDKDFWARAVHSGLSMGYVPHLLYLYTKHADQLSKSPRFRELKEADKAYAETKPYPHIWPNNIVKAIRREEKIGKIPFLGNQKRFVETT